MMIEPWSVAVDTNILVYAEGSGDPVRQDQAIAAMKQLNLMGFTLPVQVAGEFLRVQRRKLRRTAAEAFAALDSLTLNTRHAPTTQDCFMAAREIVSLHYLDIWDAVILAVAAENRCAILLSEDMQDGFVWRGTTVCNPFAERRHPLLASAFDQ
jgi:predicted nucleic acid-binding protein